MGFALLTSVQSVTRYFFSRTLFSKPSRTSSFDDAPSSLTLPSVVGQLHDFSGSYDLGSKVLAGLAFLGFVASFLLLIMDKKGDQVLSKTEEAASAPSATSTRAESEYSDSGSSAAGGSGSGSGVRRQSHRPSSFDENDKLMTSILAADPARMDKKRAQESARQTMAANS